MERKLATTLIPEYSVLLSQDLHSSEPGLGAMESAEHDVQLVEPDFDAKVPKRIMSLLDLCSVRWERDGFPYLVDKEYILEEMSCLK